MAVKPAGSTFVDRAVQWAKDVGQKVKAAVAEYTGASGYADAKKPMAEHFDASALVRAAAKFSKGFEPIHGESITMRPVITVEDFQKILTNNPDLRAVYDKTVRDLEGDSKKINKEPIHGESITMRPVITVEDFQKILTNNPDFRKAFNKAVHDLKSE